MADQYFGWFSRPGGGLYVLAGVQQVGQDSSLRLRSLTDSLPAGSVLRCDLSYDATRALFAYCRHYPELAALPNKLDKKSLPEDAFYHLYEVGLDGSGLRKLTAGKYDDFDGDLPRRPHRVRLHATRPIRADDGRDCTTNLRRGVA